MKRLTALPLMAFVLAVACDEPTGPDASAPKGSGPSLQAVPSDQPCPPTIAGGTWQNIIVPENMICSITGATVLGNITVLQGAQLFSTNNDVRGNIQADKARRVNITTTSGSPLGSVGGSIEIKEGPGIIGLFTDYMIQNVPVARDIKLIKNIGGFSITGNTLLAGNLIVEDNVVLGGFLTVQNNFVGGNIQAFKNVGGGSKFVSFNTANESIQCKENSLPFFGGGNTARKFEGQCSGILLP